MTAGYGYSAYPYYLPPATTSSSGDATLWLFPDGPNDDYTITASPPAGSGLVTFNVSNVTVVSDVTIIVVLQFSQSPPPPTCPLSQGFWKTHSNLWPVTSLKLGSQTYTQSELLVLLDSPVKRDASLNLAHQLIAAKLNVAKGSDEAPVATTIRDADGLLLTFAGKLPYQVKSSSAMGRTMNDYLSTLDKYNTGLLTGSCTQATFITQTSTPPASDVRALQAEVDGLATAGVLKGGQAQSLRAKLDAALAQLDRAANRKSAAGSIRAFIHEVEALTRARTLTTQTRDRLVGQANSILSQLR